MSGDRTPRPIDLLGAMHDPVHCDLDPPKKPRFRRLRYGKVSDGATHADMREALRQAMADWDAATPEQRQAALDAAARRAEESRG